MLIVIKFLLIILIIPVNADDVLMLPSNNKLLIYYPFNGNTNDESGNKNHAINHGAQLTKDRFENYKNAYSFNGLDDNYIEVVDPSILSFSNESFSISLWTKIKDNLNLYRTFFVISNEEIMPRIELMKARSGYDDGRIYFQVSNTQDSQSTASSLKNGQDLEKDKWFHIVGVADYENLELSLYLDSELQERSNLIPFFKMPTGDSLSARIGQTTRSFDENNKQRHNDKIDDLMIFKGTLSETQVKYLFNKDKK